MFYFSIYWEESSHLTNSIMFQRGGEKPPTRVVRYDYIDIYTEYNMFVVILGGETTLVLGIGSLQCICAV